MAKILDPLLLEEMIQYNETGNFDRIIAAELAIGLAMKLDPIMGRVGDKEDARLTSLFKTNKKNMLAVPDDSTVSRRALKLQTKTAPEMTSALISTFAHVWLHSWISGNYFRMGNNTLKQNCRNKLYLPSARHLRISGYRETLSGPRTIPKSRQLFPDWT